MDLDDARGSWRFCLLGTPLELSGASTRAAAASVPSVSIVCFLPCVQCKPNSTALHPDHGPCPAPHHPPKLSLKDLLTPATEFPISDCEPSPPQGQMDSLFIYPKKHGLQKGKKPIRVLLCPKKPKQSRRQEASPAILPSRQPSKVMSRQRRRAAGKEGWHWRGEL